MVAATANNERKRRGHDGLRANKIIFLLRIEKIKASSVSELVMNQVVCKIAAGAWAKRAKTRKSKRELMMPKMSDVKANSFTG